MATSTIAVRRRHGNISRQAALVETARWKMPLAGGTAIADAGI